MQSDWYGPSPESLVYRLTRKDRISRECEREFALVSVSGWLFVRAYVWLGPSFAATQTGYREVTERVTSTGTETELRAHRAQDILVSACVLLPRRFLGPAAGDLSG